MEHISENEEDNDNLSVNSIPINNDLNSQKDCLLQELELIKRNIAENNRVRFYMENELNEITRARDEKLRENEELMSHNESIVQNIWRNQEDLLRIQNEKPGFHQRTVMLRKCGRKCFLGPKKSFPICKKNTCKISSKGVYAAYIRARQYRTKSRKYRNISRKAKRMLIRMGAKR